MSDHRLPRIMAHRGARALWAENSAFGFKNTVAAGFDAVEFDLHLTDAGEVVVIHDPMLERTTTGTGAVRHLTPDSRAALRLKGPDGTLINEGVPSFDDVLDILVPQAGLDLFVELKIDETGHPYPGLTAAVAEICRARGIMDRVVLHSFHLDIVREARDLAPEARRLTSVNHEWAAKQGGLAAFLREVTGDHLVDIVGIEHMLYEEEFATVSRLMPLDHTSVWTVNDADLMRRWAARRVGFLTSDNPIMARQIRDALSD